MVTEVLPNTTYRVKIDDMEKIVLASMSGRMRKANIKVILGDHVKMEFSVYDFDRGRIVRRL